MRCKNCKEKFEPIHFNQKFCFKEECKKVWIETEKAKQWVKRKKELKEDLETVQSLMKKAQKVFNEYVRLRDKGKGCISCGKELSGKYDAGHFWSSGGHKFLTFHEDNCHAQCVFCNQHKHGNLIEYQLGLFERIGKERYDYLEQNRHNIFKPSREDLKEIIKEYKQKIADIKK